MNPTTDFTRFAEIITGMFRLYGQAPDTVITDAYWFVLKDWKLSDFEQAARLLMAREQFLPKPSQFNALKRASNPTPEEAWEIANADHTIWRTSKTCGNELIDRVVRTIGGYEHLAMCNVETQLPFARRNFIEAYVAIADAEATRTAVPDIANVRDATLQLNRARLARAMTDVGVQPKDLLGD